MTIVRMANPSMDGSSHVHHRVIAGEASASGSAARARPARSEQAQFRLDHRIGSPASSRIRRRAGGGSRLPSPRRSRSSVLFCIGYQISTGVGVWGLNSPVGWAWDITNFVFWIGIGHAGTLISAILFLLRQKWRTSINRVGRSDDAFRGDVRRHFPGHSRRPRLDGVVPRARPEQLTASGRTSAARCCGTCSRSRPISRCRCSSGTPGLVPDLATLRDRATSKIKKFLYGIFALGWRGRTATGAITRWRI